MKGPEDLIQTPRKQEDSFTRWHLSPTIRRRNLPAGDWQVSQIHAASPPSVVAEQVGTQLWGGESTQQVSG